MDINGVDSENLMFIENVICEAPWTEISQQHVPISPIAAPSDIPRRDVSVPA